MNIDVITGDDGAMALLERPTIRLEGRFDANDCADFRREFDALLDRQASTVAIDLAEVDFVDSAALAELVRGMKRCRERGGDLLLVGLSSAVQVIFELTGLDKAFTIDRR